MPPLQADQFEQQATEAGFTMGLSIHDAQGNERTPNIGDLRELMRNMERSRVKPGMPLHVQERYNRIKHNHLITLQWAIEELEAMDAFIKAHHAKATK